MRSSVLNMERLWMRDPLQRSKSATAGVGGGDGRPQGRRDLGGDRIASVGVVDGDGGDAIGDVDDDEIRHPFRLRIAGCG